MLEEAINQGNLELFKDIVAVDFVDNTPTPGFSPTREGLKQEAEAVRASFPDLRVSVDDVVAEGDRVAVRWTLTGTHTGDEFLGIPPAGNQATVPGMEIYRIEDDRIAESWECVDYGGLAEQLRANSPKG